MKVIEGRPGTFWFKCPGCGGSHAVYTKEAGRNIAWGFNGNVDSPTFTPSLLVTWGPSENPRKNICHSFITNGVMSFCGDSTHSMAGKSIELPELNAAEWEWIKPTNE